MIKSACSRLPQRRECGCATALQNALITARNRIPSPLEEKFALLIEKYIS
jgi:hypothetical protein